MEQVYLLLGGNLGDKPKIFTETEQLIAETIGNIRCKSRIYETEPWGFESEEWFWNQAFLVETNLSVSACLEAVHRIEKLVGRVRSSQQYSSRIIDIDLIFFGDQVIDQPELIVPHPRMAARKFVLQPLCEISAEKIHPVFQKTIQELLDECDDSLEVRIANHN